MRARIRFGKIFAMGACAALILVAFGAGAAQANSPIRVGKGFPGVFDFTPLDIGMQEGFFKKHGLDVQPFSFNGGAKLQQGLAANAIDVGLGAGTSLAFVKRGSPVKGIAAFMGPPANLVLFVRKEPSIHTLADLKGKRISVSTIGSLTFWLAHRFSVREGWGPNGIKVTPLGAPSAQISALREKQVDGMVTDLVKATVMQQKGYGLIMLHFNKVVPDFITHVVFARNSFIKAHPQELREFLAAWFETIAYMRSHKAETVKIAAAVMHQPSDVVATTYDVTMPAFSSTGRFEAKPLAVLRRSFVEMKLLPEAPDMQKLYTEQFLPHTGS